MDSLTSRIASGFRSLERETSLFRMWYKTTSKDYWNVHLRKFGCNGHHRKCYCNCRPVTPVNTYWLSPFL